MGSSGRSSLFELSALFRGVSPTPHAVIPHSTPFPSAKFHIPDSLAHFTTAWPSSRRACLQLKSAEMFYFPAFLLSGNVGASSSTWDANNKL